MATTNDKVQSKKKKKGLFSSVFRALGMIMSALGYVVIALVISIIIEWVGIVFWWEPDHARQMFSAELRHLGHNFSTSVAGVSPADLAIQVTSYTKSLLTQNSFVLYLNAIANQPQSAVFFSFIAKLINSIATYVEAALFVCMTVSLRLTIIALSCLIIVLISIITAIDGLVERELRNYGGDLEHSRIVHIALAWAPELAIAAPIVYLAWPTIANPVYFFVPAMTLFGIANYVLFSKYQQRL